MANTFNQYQKSVAIERNSAKDILTRIKTTFAGLKEKGAESLQAVLSSANRDSSAWHALDAEYGPHEPITSGFMSDVVSLRMQQHIDRYRR